MYGFHKVKNDRGVHEFRHPSFKKGQYDDLVNIKRKNISNQKGEDHPDKELDADEYNKLRENLERTKASLESITHKNMSLITANKEVASKLYSFKHDYETRLKKLFFMFYFLINSKDEKLLNLLKKILMETGVAFERDSSQNYEDLTLEVIEHINKRILVSSNCEQVIITNLLNVFVEHLTTKNYFSDELSLKPLEIGVDDIQNTDGYAGFEFQYVTSPRKSIQSLNINLISETISECDFSGHNSIMMQKSPVLRFDMFDTQNKACEFDLERLMIPVGDSEARIYDSSSNNRHGYKKRPFYDI